METLQITLYANPFPLMVVDNFYNEEELNLIWEELNFYTRPEKLLNAEGYGGIVDYTNAKALILDEIYTKQYEIQNDDTFIVKGFAIRTKGAQGFGLQVSGGQNILSSLQRHKTAADPK